MWYARAPGWFVPGLILVALFAGTVGSAPSPESGAVSKAWSPESEPDAEPWSPVILPGGVFLGFTHGGDPVPDPDDDVDVDVEPGPHGVTDTGFPRALHCVENDVPPQVEPRALLIYARAHDDEDRYAAKAPVIRNLAASSNALVHDAGVKTGTAANLKVACEDGVVLVVDAVLPTDRVDASPNSIMNDLRLKGHNDAAVKHWVYYDDRSACGCGGIANLMRDSTPTALNLNNGWASSMYAITFGYDSTRIMLHELGHTMGAVQNSAPHSTGAGHCTDGRDIMCYNDGGPRAGGYTTGACTVQVWDCGNDDYFHTNPGTDDYLFDHWNLGS